MTDNKWEERVKKQKKMEKQIIGVLLLIASIGIVSDILTFRGRIIYSVHNYDSLSLVVIQIQTTVFALTIALVALLGGRITDEFLGVKYNNFILSVKPYYLTQKRIVRLLLAFLVINVFHHILGLYNMVISVFTITVIMVAYSASVIYEAFTGTEQIEDEVSAFVDYSIENKNTQLSTFNAFCDQWIKECTGQETGEYERYLEVFKRGILELVRTDSTRSILLDNCTALLRQLLKKSDTAIRGINTLKECYNQVWIFVRDNCSDGEIELSSQRVPFYLFENIYNELIEAIIGLKVRDAEKTFSWNSLTELILLVDMYIGYNAEDLKQNTEIGYIEEFGEFSGYYISPKCSGANAAERTNAIWGKSLFRPHTNSTLPDNMKYESERILANRNFRFMVAQIKYDNASLVKEFFYSRAIHRSHELSQPYAFMVLKYHCYLYYLAEFETLDCISLELRNRANAFLEDNQVVEMFTGFLVSLLERDKNISVSEAFDLDLFNNKLVNELAEDLRLFEYYPRNGDAKVKVMDHSVRQFVLFTASYISNNFYRPELFMRIIPEEQSAGYYSAYASKNDHRKELQRFLRFVGVEDTYIQDKTDACYACLVNGIRDKYKLYSIHEAEKSEKTLDRELLEKKDELSEKIKDYLETRLVGILGSSEGDTCEVTLMSIPALSDQQVDSLLFGYYDWCFSRFIWEIAHKLYKDGKIDVISRKTFDLDDNLLEYINLHKDSVIIGSVSALRPNDLRRKAEFLESIYAAEHYTIGAPGLVLILDKNSLKINITKVRVDTHIPTINETNAKYNKETDLYSYEVSSGMVVDFTKEELQNYLNDMRRVVDIGIQFTIETKDGKIGDVVQK